MAYIEPIKLRKAQIRPILERSFPQYRGRTFRLRFSETVTFRNTNWSGGTRSRYMVLRADGEDRYIHVPAPWENGIEGQTVELHPGVLVVEHSILCGKNLGITVYAHPTYAPKWLTAGEGAR